MPFIKILDGTNVPSIGTLYKKGDVITTKHGRNTKVIVYLDVFTSDPNYYELTVKYDKLTNNYPKLVDFNIYYTGPSSSSYKTGYHIFTRLTSLPPSIIANNISRFDNGKWFNYMSYSNAPEVLDLKYKVKNNLGCFLSTGGKFYAHNIEIGDILAESGIIGSLQIESDRVKMDYGVDGSGMFLYSYMLVFNKPDRQVILGPTNVLGGYDYMCRMIDSSVDSVGAIGLNVGVTKRVENNIAINITGGYIAGINYKTRVYGFTKENAETGPIEETIDRDVNMVIASTEYTVGNTKYSRDVYLHLPEMRNCDDGHILKIKRGSNNGNKVYIVNGKTN